MKTMVLTKTRAIGLRWALRRVRNSMKVAEWYWTAAFVFMMLAGGAENVIIPMIGVVLLAHATLHRLKVEKRKERDNGRTN